MIHALIDTVDHRKIVGYETGTRAQFDERHGGDPLWVFLDSYKVRYRANLQNFLTYPTQYQLDQYDDLFLSDEPPIVDVEEIPDTIPGYSLLKGRDGRYLKGADGLFLYNSDATYVPPPAGQVYIIDPDNQFLKDPDEKWLTETE